MFMSTLITKRRRSSMPDISSPNKFPRNPGGHIVLPRDNVLIVCMRQKYKKIIYG